MTIADVNRAATQDRPAAPPDSTRKPAATGRDSLALDAVFEIAKFFAVAPDPLEIVPEMLNVLSSFLDLRHGVLALLSDEPSGADTVNPYTIAATAFVRRDGTPMAEVVPDQVLRIVFRSGVPLVSFDLAAEFGGAAVPKRLQGARQSIYAVPIRDPDRSHFVQGVLCAFRSHDGGPAVNSNADLRVLTMVASLLEQALRFRRRIARDRERALGDMKRVIDAAERMRGKTPLPVAIDGIVGDSPAITEVIDQIQRVASKKTPVLLRGESGTGKELFARAVHSASTRAKQPFVAVNCAALSETLLEAELFGHEKGAFTGASALKKGRFELADGGTLFLDEIGEISPTFQTKLLRVLQEGEFERVGGTRTLKVDVRIVAATNRDLESCVANGEFRADLYFRICVVPIVLPPLRDRKSDIRPLAQLFLDRFNKSNGTDVQLAPDAYQTICSCSFPGNVRELENCVNRAAALSDGKVVLGQELACRQGACLSSTLTRQRTGHVPIGGLATGIAPPPPDAPSPEPVEIDPLPPISAGDAPRRKTANTAREELIAAMEEAGWVQAKAGRLLGMTPRQISYALRKHGVEVRRILARSVRRTRHARPRWPGVRAFGRCPHRPAMSRGNVPKPTIAEGVRKNVNVFRPPPGLARRLLVAIERHSHRRGTRAHVQCHLARRPCSRIEGYPHPCHGE